MPELPEVETIRLTLRDGGADAPSLVGQRIAGVSLRWPRHIVQPSVSSFRRKILDRQVTDVGRRGKYILVQLDRGHLVVHLMMSGDLGMAPPGAPRGPYDHTVFQLHSGWQLRFGDARKFGRVYLLDDLQALLGELGPEPLSAEFSPESLGALLGGRKRALKPLLLDQQLIAGVGNIYADEALHRAKLHPLQSSESLTPAQVRRLWEGIRSALQQGIRHNGASIDWVYRGGDFQNHFRVYGRAGEGCPNCGTPIERIVAGQRGTHFCPSCQPLREG